MSEDFNRPNFGQEPESSNGGSSAPRARNRTVLLNSETAGKLRRQFEDGGAASNTPKSEDPWKQPKMESGSGPDSFFGGGALGYEQVNHKRVEEPLSAFAQPNSQVPQHNDFAGIIGVGNDYNQPHAALSQPEPQPRPEPQVAFDAKPVAFEPQPVSQPVIQPAVQSQSQQSAFGASFGSPQFDAKPQGTNEIFASHAAAPMASESLLRPQPTQKSVSETQAIQGVVSQHDASVVFDSSESEDHIMWYRMTKVVGFLLSFDKSDSGDFYPLRTGRLLVTRDAQGPKATKSSYFLLADDSVSVGHAILRLSESGNEVQVEVLDQLSEDGTKIVTEAGEVNLSGDKGSVKHGDKLVFGGRTFTVLLNG